MHHIKFNPVNLFIFYVYCSLHIRKCRYEKGLRHGKLLSLHAHPRTLGHPDDATAGFGKIHALFLGILQGRITGNNVYYICLLLHQNIKLITFPIFQSGTLMITGTTIFCGTIYYHALTEEKVLRKYTPYGGIVLMLAWVSMLL